MRAILSAIVALGFMTGSAQAYDYCVADDAYATTLNVDYDTVGGYLLGEAIYDGSFLGVISGEVRGSRGMFSIDYISSSGMRWYSFNVPSLGDAETWGTFSDTTPPAYYDGPRAATMSFCADDVEVISTASGAAQ